MLHFGVGGSIQLQKFSVSITIPGYHQDQLSERHNEAILKITERTGKKRECTITVKRLLNQKVFAE